MTPFTASYEWCHVMCSTVFGDVNNLCNLGVIGKFLNFICATSPSPPSFGFKPNMPTCIVLGKIYIFMVIQHAKFWTYVNFLVF